VERRNSFLMTPDWLFRLTQWAILFPLGSCNHETKNTDHQGVFVSVMGAQACGAHGWVMQIFASNRVVVHMQWRLLEIPGTQQLLHYARQLVNSCENLTDI